MADFNSPQNEGRYQPTHLGPPPSWRPGAEPPKPRRRRRKVAVAVIAGVLLIGGVGGGAFAFHKHSVAQHEREVKAEKEREEAAAQRAEEERQAAELAEQQAVFDSCNAELTGFERKLNSIDARLNVGLSQSELSTLVGDASVAYNKVEVNNLGQGACLAAGAKLEKALNSYISTVSTWNDCIFDLYCDVDSIDPLLQLKWAHASKSITKADDLMATLDPSSPNFGGDSGGDSDGI